MARRRRRYEPRNLAFTDGLDRWRLGGSCLREATGSHDQDYSCTTEGGRAILTAAVPEPFGFAFLSQEIFADDYRGHTVVLRGELCTQDVADRAGLVLRVVTEGPLTPPHQTGSEARHDPGNHFAPVSGSHDWTRHEVTAQIPGDATIVGFGIFLNGRGQIELRNAELSST